MATASINRLLAKALVRLAPPELRPIGCETPYSEEDSQLLDAVLKRSSPAVAPVSDYQVKTLAEFMRAFGFESVWLMSHAETVVGVLTALDDMAIRDMLHARPDGRDIIVLFS